MPLLQDAPRTDIKNLAELLPWRDSPAEEVAMASMELRLSQRWSRYAISNLFACWHLSLSVDMRPVPVITLQTHAVEMKILVEMPGKIMVISLVWMFLLLLCNLSH
ncbi:unnamed protein product [Periconia digitata]|uniref:Uncharacterized protein n=1 Tax=Periconia digitata TaxID=1303443 RepID=A0A9W4XXN3_9PLEO|nr:unnamed protein product [Periconia digitata]